MFNGISHTQEIELIHDKHVNLIVFLHAGNDYSENNIEKNVVIIYYFKKGDKSCLRK